MRFLVDECAGPSLARWLTENGHEVFSVYDEARGVSDDEILRKALEENWILITSDKDFGDKVYRDHYPHHGIVLLRLDNNRSQAKIGIIKRLLSKHSHSLADQFVVVTDDRVRFARR